MEAKLLRTKYPQGGEKQLIYALTGKEVPSGGLPFNVGIIVQNVGTASKIYYAVAKGEPLIRRVATVSGEGVVNPSNLNIPIGTKISDVLDFCGTVDDEKIKVIMGGPMMGFTQSDLTVPVIKSTSGILVMPGDVVIKEDYTDCIRCGTCIYNCPMNLMPNAIAKAVQNEQEEEYENWNVMDCMECGCCAYDCPANIPLVHFIKVAKNKVWMMQRK